jgi:hypothetical protein
MRQAGAPLRALQMKSFTSQQGTVTHLRGFLLPSIAVSGSGQCPAGRQAHEGIH